MTDWYVHRRPDGSIASIHAEAQPGYTDPAPLADDHASIVAFLEAARPPVVVSRLRLKLELAERGLLDDVEAAVQAAGATPQMYWAEATQFESNHALVAQIGAAVGLDAGEIRELFQAAVSRDA
jgi:hypothetical protein